jgi:hypothetical protein
MTSENLDSTLPPFIRDFDWAVVRLATYQPKGQAGRLLFATVTLLPSDRPPPSKMAGIDPMSLARTGISIFFRRVVMRADEAITWYRSLDSAALTPLPSRPEDVEADKDGVHPIAVSNLIDDPAWPKLGLPMEGSLFSQASETANPAPFINSKSARIHRRLGKADGFEAFLNNPAAVDFLARRLHINLRDYPEYLGTIVLVVPNPIVKQIDNFLLPGSNGRGERVFYRFVPRNGHSLDGLKIALFDQQAGLLSNYESRDIPATGILDLEKGTALGEYGYLLTHPVHGVLAYNPPASFIRTINFNMSLVHEVRQIHVPAGEAKDSAMTEYRVKRVTREHESAIRGDDIPPNPNVRIAQAARSRNMAASAAHHDQHWFGSGSRQAAMEFIRSRVGRARKRILVADPYFGVLEIPQFLLAITSDTVKVQILTSALAFGGDSAEAYGEDGNESKVARRQRRTRRFQREVERLKKMGNAQVDVVVLLGQSPSLHDRFLVVDDEVWFLGNSLNTLGERASMVIRLPDPRPVIRKLETMFSLGRSFDKYYQQHGSAKQVET